MISPDFSKVQTLAYLLGALLGDGNVRKQPYMVGKYPEFDYTIRLKVKDREFAEDVYNALKEIG